MSINPYSLSQALVLDALRQVHDPDLKKDLVSLGMIQQLTISPEGAVAFHLVLTTPACPMKAQMQKACQDAVEKLPGVTSVRVTLEAQVRNAVFQPNVRAIPGVKQVLAVSSGKGGVGKTTVAVNLAVSLALEGAKVGLVDADIYGPNIPLMMGMMEKPGLQGERFLPPVAYEVKVLSMGMLLERDQPVIWRGPMLHKLLEQFFHQVEWGDLDYLVVDMPPGTGDVQLSLAQLVPVTGVVLVSTPQEVSLQDVRRAFYMFQKVNVPVLGLVENMSFFQCEQCQTPHFLFGKKGGAALAQALRLPLLGEIPLVEEVRQGGDVGEPIVFAQPHSPAAVALRAMSRQVAHQISVHTLSTPSSPSTPSAKPSEEGLRLYSIEKPVSPSAL